MLSHEVYVCRRKALGLSKNDLANKANIQVQYVEFFEQGYNVPTFVKEKIRDTIRDAYSSMDSISHYRTRILELALEIKDETNVLHVTQEISHMMVELGKLQRELISGAPKKKEDWA